MNFFPNYPVIPNMPLPINDIPNTNWMNDMNNVFNKFNDFENRIKKLEQKVSNLENNFKNNDYQEPDNSLYMI